MKIFSTNCLPSFSKTFVFYGLEILVNWTNKNTEECEDAQVPQTDDQENGCRVHDDVGRSKAKSILTDVTIVQLLAFYTFEQQVHYVVGKAELSTQSLTIAGQYV